MSDRAGEDICSQADTSICTPWNDVNAKRAHLCSAFYERMKEVREYHRRYPYLEVAEVSAACALSAFWQPPCGAPVRALDQTMSQNPECHLQVSTDRISSARTA